jgi:hypothetical protein
MALVDIFDGVDGIFINLDRVDAEEEYHLASLICSLFKSGGLFNMLEIFNKNNGPMIFAI